MANYSRTNDFSVKDALATGNPNKLIKGSEIDDEFDAIVTMSATKANKVVPSAAGNLATLSATGDLQDSGSTGLFPAGTKMLFQQTAAPTGWTKVTSGVDDKALRVVSGTVGSGGTSAFSTVFGKTATDGHTLALSEIPAHTHTQTTYALQPSFSLSNNGARVGATTGTTGSAGGGGAHSHNMDIRVQYLDVIIATKDA